ncbi:MAG: Hsp33 family molecular chaperone HslO [Bacilli bacterium]|nr:Hsp33 family molecular chaperone HslO [Bacilli bacterium]
MDYIIKALARSRRVRAYLARTTKVTNEAIVTHDLWPSAASVLGKTLTIGLLMGAMLKGEEALTIKVDGNGPIGVVIVDSNAKGEVRGYVGNSHVHFSRKGALDDVTTLGYNGYIDVIKDLKLKDLYSSTVPLTTGDLAKDFTYYFASSEQTPTLTSLGVIINEDNSAKISGGLIIQLMPDALEADIEFLESKTLMLSSFSELLNKYDDLESILQLIFGEDFKVLDKMAVTYHCDCSKDKFARGIASLSFEEIKDIIETDGKAEVICRYCRKQYLYSKEELEIIEKERKS